MTIKRLGTNARISKAVVHGGTVYLAGQVADNVDGDTESQTRETLAKIEKLLKEAGSDKSRILSAQIWLADISEAPKMNAVWEAWLPKGAAPARATVQSALATPRHLIEIKVIAAQ